MTAFPSHRLAESYKSLSKSLTFWNFRTIDSIRDDLEHIHNLEVVDIMTLAGGHLLVSTNDVSLAVTARTCMGSRLKYKGSRVEFYPDECCEPLPPVMRKTYQDAPPAPKEKTFTNRFQMLAGVSDEEEDWRT